MALGLELLELAAALAVLAGAALWYRWRRSAKTREQLWLQALGAIVERDYASAQAAAVELQAYAETASVPKETAYTLSRVVSRIEGLELQQREEYTARRELEDVLASLQDAVLVVDGETRLHFLNAAAVAFFGVRVKDVLGAQLLEALPTFVLESSVRATLQTGQPSAEEISLYVSRPREVLLRVAAVRRSDGSVSGAVVILQDLTELRRLERVRRDFVANASHELRTPIANVRALAETILSAPQQPELAARFLPRLVAEAERLSRLVNDLLDLTRAESQAESQLEPPAAPVDLAAVSDAVVQRLADKALQHRIEVRHAYPEGGPDGGAGCCVRGDASGLEQVVFNLLDNALSYTAPGGSVTLRLEPAANPNGAESDNDVTCARHMQQEQHGAPDRREVALSVTDTGIGIPPEDIGRIFERFYRVDKARSRAEGGTGLGLAIVKHIVENHGGHVSVESEVGRGSTFTVSLPAATPNP